MYKLGEKESTKIVSKQDGEKTWTSVMGLVITIIAIAILLSTAIWSLWGNVDSTKNNIPPLNNLVAISFFLIMLGISFLFPSLLSDENHGLSTMRVVVFMIIAVFVTIVIKEGWKNDALANINPNWMYIILAALGGKTVQSYTEYLTNKASMTKKINPKTIFPATAKKGQAFNLEFQDVPVILKIDGDTAQPIAVDTTNLKFTYTPSTEIVASSVTLKATAKSDSTISSDYIINIT